MADAYVKTLLRRADELHSESRAFQGSVGHPEFCRKPCCYNFYQGCMDMWRNRSRLFKRLFSGVPSFQVIFEGLLRFFLRGSDDLCVMGIAAGLFGIISRVLGLRRD